MSRPGPPRSTRVLAIAAGSLLAVVGLAYGGLALFASELTTMARDSCDACLEERHQADVDPRGCLPSRSFHLLRLAPWAHADDAERECRMRMFAHGLRHSVYLIPDRARRDRWLEEWGEGASLHRLYRAAAFDRVIAEADRVLTVEDAAMLMSAAMHSRSLDTLRSIVRRYPVPGSGSFDHWAFESRRGAWLCLLGHEQEGRRILERWVESGRGRPGLFEGNDPAPLLLYACGGPPPSDATHPFFWGAPEPELHVALADGRVRPEDVLARTELPPRSRRHALALALRDADSLPVARTLGWLRATAAPGPVRRCAAEDVLGGPAIAVDPDAAADGAARLLAWLTEQHEALAALEAQLPPMWPGGESSRRVDISAYARTVAADLRLDAGLAFFGRGDHERGLAEIRAAGELGARECALVFHLVGEPIPEPGQIGDVFEDALSSALWHESHGRGEAALELLLRDARPETLDSDAYLLITRLGLTLERDPPEWWAPIGRIPGSPDWNWWASLRTHSEIELRRAFARDASMQRFSRGRRSALRVESVRWLERRAAQVEDAALFVAAVQAEQTGRAALWMRAHEAQGRGEEAEAAAWRAWYREIAALASSTSRALLLSYALGDPMPYITRTDGQRIPRLPPPEWGAPTRWNSLHCPDGVWALVPGHLPAQDDAELAYRHLERDQIAAEARARTYFWRGYITPHERPRPGHLSLWVPGPLWCDSGVSEYTASLPVLGEEEVGSLTDDHYLGSFGLHVGHWPARIDLAGGVRSWRSEQRGVHIPLDRLEEGADDLYELQLALRIRGVAVDRAAGAWIDAELVGLQVRQGERLLYDVTTDDPPSALVQ